MQAVILAAGEGTRMRPITHHVPKPLVRFHAPDGTRKTTVESNLELLPPEVDELLFVVGYLKEQVMNYFGDEFQGRRVQYIEQKKPLGTGHAVALVSKHIKDRFLVMMGDDLYSQVDIDACFAVPGSALLVQKVRSKYSGGNVTLDAQGNLKAIEEGTHSGGLLNAALYVLTPDYFSYDPVPIKNGAEYGLPQTIVTMAADHPVKVVEAQWWQQVTDMNDIKRLPQLLTKRPSAG